MNWSYVETELHKCENLPHFGKFVAQICSEGFEMSRGKCY